MAPILTVTLLALMQRSEVLLVFGERGEMAGDDFLALSGIVIGRIVSSRFHCRAVEKKNLPFAVVFHIN